MIEEKVYLKNKQKRHINKSDFFSKKSFSSLVIYYINNNNKYIKY